MCMTVVREANPKARKEHSCIWCGEKILVGEKHRQQAGVVSGDFQDNRYHEECWTPALESFRKGDCDFEEAGFKRGTNLPPGTEY